MYRLAIDPSVNLLAIHWTGHVDPEEAKRCGEEIRQHLSDIQPGIRILTDLSGLESMDYDCAPHIDRMMDLFNERGIDTVVRVIPNPYKDIGFSIMSLFHYRHGVHIMTCESLEEAKKILQA
jgi:hypothetical protein